MRGKLSIWIALVLVIFLLVIGTVGYSTLNQYSVWEAFYMTVITISTVGFGEVISLNTGGQIFTVFLIASGVGIIAFALHVVTESMIERASNPNKEKRIMERKIQKLKKHSIICGFGRVGHTAADHFSKAGAPFVVLEKNEEYLKLLKEEGYLYLEGDATSESLLLAAGIKSAESLMALLDSDPENLFTVLTARELNPTLHIIARTEIASSESRILRAGADSVISPYQSAGRRVADRVLSKMKDSWLAKEENNDTANNHRWVKVTEQTDLEGHAIGFANSLVGGVIVGLRRGRHDYLTPAIDMKIALDDELLVVLKEEVAQEQPVIKQKQKIVLIDDNPVIRRLYTRLFQKAGFVIITAETGKEGYAMIMEEKPDAAVIDFMLPDVSGDEICRQLRESDDGKEIKLFLFTADEKIETKEKALASGADTVVVKSPEASEIITLVQNSLS